jgi:hypothetical protein
MRALALLAVALAGCGADASLEGTWAGEQQLRPCAVGFRLEASAFELRRACGAGVQVFGGRAVVEAGALSLQVERSSCPGGGGWRALPFERVGERLHLQPERAEPPWVLARAAAMPGEGQPTGCYDGERFAPGPVQ